MWARMQLPYLVGKYLGDRRAKNLDLVATCPTNARISKASAAGQPWYYQLYSHYIANTGSGTATKGNPPPNVQGSKPYYATKPRDYFGYMKLGSPDDLKKYTNAEMPKKIDRIKDPSREWAIADLWDWEAAPPRGTTRRVGTWPFDLANGVSGSVSNGTKLKIPAYPYHLSVNAYDSDISSGDRSINSARLNDGRTNIAYMDGHAATARRFEGTVNPCFDKDANAVCD
jgi:prepilin-type processing-associated H-X9-DG protein